MRTGRGARARVRPRVDREAERLGKRPRVAAHIAEANDRDTRRLAAVVDHRGLQQRTDVLDERHRLEPAEQIGRQLHADAGSRQHLPAPRKHARSHAHSPRVVAKRDEPLASAVHHVFEVDQ